MTLDLLIRRDAFIDGSWVHSELRFDVRNPATGQLLERVSDLGAKETEMGIAAAAAALTSWAARPARDRAGVLRRWFELVMAHQEQLAAIMTMEQGKPLAEARGEIAYAAGFIEWFAEEAKRAYGDIVPTHLANQRILVMRQPVGVVAAITPWNFPSAMITRKVAPALAAGCTIVLKPSELTPLSALALAALAHEADVPAGVLNVITGRDAAAIGGAMTASPAVRKLSFTGSTAVGKTLMRDAAGTVKKISLELGGNAPFIVFDDADIDQAVAGAVAAKYRNAGQTCICPNRFFVQTAVHDVFVERLAAAVAELRVGDGAADGTEIGPLIDARAVAKVALQIGDAVTQGARVVHGGCRSPLGGTYFLPTILTGVTSEMRVMREETFGPVSAIASFVDEADVVSQANATDAGLAAYFYTRDAARIWRVCEALEVGMVGVNTGLLSTETAPFGGVKQSGLGREGSRHGLDEYLELKYVCMGNITALAKATRGA